MPSSPYLLSLISGSSRKEQELSTSAFVRLLSGWRQAKLPPRLGGLGIHSPADCAVAAFVAASWAVDESFTRIHGSELPRDVYRDEARARLQTLFGGEGPAVGMAQRDISQEQQAVLVENFVAHMVPADQARFRAANACWLTWGVSGSTAAAMLPAVGNMTPAEMRAALAYQLGLPVFGEGETECCYCGGRLDAGGVHAVNCKIGPTRNRRHNAVRDWFAEAAAGAGLPASVEVRCPGHPEIRTDVVIEATRPLAIDFGIVNPLAGDYFPRSARDGTLAQRVYADEKSASQAQAFAAAGWDFVPAVCSTFGRWDDRAMPIFQLVAEHLARRANVEAPFVRSKLIHALSFVRMRGVARCIVARRTPAQLEGLAVLRV